MFTHQINKFFVTTLFTILGVTLRVGALEDSQRLDVAMAIAKGTYSPFLDMFTQCVGTPVPSQQYKIDNVKGFINYPSRTTVGSAPRLTSNRKFFANVIATREFKEVLEKDINVIRMNFIKKMKYCDSIVMNQNIVKDFYDREVDQSKI